ncbi:ChaN family lipoprotein [Flavobacterium sp.]|uniref:ChaN family lipoprotein n=1 Tax=Flavobacterium sp. TaxID=239 RepID=UPI00374D5B4A
MKRIIFLSTLILFIQKGIGQEKLPFIIFDGNGREASYKDMLKASEKAEVVLFGEEHNNAIAHWLQLELTKDLAEKKQLVLGAEMLEADNQKQLDQYLKGEINQKQLDSTARLWPNYKTDYKPLVDFAKTKKIAFIATNIPRRFASLVYKNGFSALDNLTVEEKSWIAPMPISYDAKLPGYIKMLAMAEGHGGENLPKSQASKDATMAYFILKNKKPETTFIHYNGTYHSDNFEGINWYLLQKEPKLKIVTIATVTQSDVIRFEKENLHKADFIIVVDEDVTRTY